LEFGGVVPELASRLHAIDLPIILEEIKPYFNTLKAISVTANTAIISTKNSSSFIKVRINEANIDNSEICYAALS
jgi:hypothetical protein